MRCSLAGFARRQNARAVKALTEKKKKGSIWKPLTSVEDEKEIEELKNSKAKTLAEVESLEKEEKEKTNEETNEKQKARNEVFS